MRKALIVTTFSLLLAGCWSPSQARYNIQQEQHERSLDQIMDVYDARCGVHRGPEYLERDDSFCNGVRESYWAIQRDRNLQGFPEYEKLREAKKEVREARWTEPSAR